MSECTCLQGNAVRQVILKPVNSINVIPDSYYALHILSPACKRNLRGTTSGERMTNCIAKKCFSLKINSLIKTILK